MKHDTERLALIEGILATAIGAIVFAALVLAPGSAGAQGLPEAPVRHASGLLPGAAAPGGAAAPDDLLYPQQWGLQQVHAEAAWRLTRGAGSLIAIVDSGIDRGHPDLAANLVGGNTFLDCGAAGCGDGDWRGGHVHGTHVAGIAAAVAANGTGIAGVAPEAAVLAVRVLDADGSGSFEDIARGIRWAVDQGANVINLSLGALPGAQALSIVGVVDDVAEAADYAAARGAVVVAAAGNEAVPLCAEPGFAAGVVCVTATDRREFKAWYANAAVKPDLVTVAAPGGAGLSTLCGEDIVSTVPPGTGTADCGYPDDLAYDEFAGTSMAAPHVAGVAALLGALGCTREQSIGVLTATARLPFTALRGVWSPAYGYGVVDAEAAVLAAQTQC